MRLRSLLAAFALTCAAAGPSSAQQPLPQAAQQGPGPTAAGEDQDDGASAAAGGRRGRGALAACRSDVRALCGGIDGGTRKERIACLRQNESKLSAECSTAIQRVVEKRAGGANGDRVGKRSDREERRGERDQRGGGQGRLAACRGDVASLCASAEAGNDGRVKCLRENAAKLSPECGQAIQNMRDHRKQLRQACATERETLCAKTEAGSGGFAGCLRQNAERLSEACSAALAAMPGGKGRRAGRVDPTSGALSSDKR